MKKGTFLHAMKNQALSIDNYTLFSNPVKLINWDTEEEVFFESVEDAYNRAMICGIPLRQIVDETETVDELFSATGVIDDSDIQIVTPEEAERLFG